MSSRAATPRRGCTTSSVSSRAVNVWTQALVVPTAHIRGLRSADPRVLRDARLGALIVFRAYWRPATVMCEKSGGDNAAGFPWPHGGGIDVEVLRGAHA
jgi:hypothetical protein